MKKQGNCQVDLHDIACIDGKRPTLAAHPTHLLTRHVAVISKLAVDESDEIKSLEQLQAAVAIVWPTAGVVSRLQQPFPSDE